MYAQWKQAFLNGWDIKKYIDGGSLRQDMHTPRVEKHPQLNVYNAIKIVHK